MALPLAELPASSAADLIGFAADIEVLLVDAAENLLALARVHVPAAYSSDEKFLRMTRVLISTVYS
jgi:hypothetical protein